MENTFQKSWSVHGYRKFDNEFRNDKFVRSRPTFQSGRATKTNLQQRFVGQSLNQSQCQNMALHPSRAPFDENECPFYLRQQPGMRFRSLTDSNIKRFEVNGVTKSCNELDSPKTSHRQPFRQLPERIGPIWNNIQHSVSRAGPKTERFLQKGGEKVQKAFQEVRTSINSFSQRFKRTTRRRYKLDSTPTRTPGRTPGRTPTHTAKVTPGKLYSPFDINTPRTPHSFMKGPKRLQYGHTRRSMFGSENFGLCRTPPQHSRMSQSNFNNWMTFNSSPFHPHSQNERNHYGGVKVFPPFANPEYINEQQRN